MDSYCATWSTLACNYTWIGIPNHPLGLHPKTHKNIKFKNVCKVICGKLLLLTIAKSDQSSWRTTHDWNPWSNMSSTKHVGDLNMNWCALLITCGGVKFVVSTKIDGLMNQLLQHPFALVHRSKHWSIAILSCQNN